MFRDRIRHYTVYGFLFAALYYLLVQVDVPDTVWPVIVLLALGKDAFDELRLQHGNPPLAYRGFEHAPSNVVILLFLLAGIVSVPGAVAGIPLESLTVMLAIVDTAWDLWQDARS